MAPVDTKLLAGMAAQLISDLKLYEADLGLQGLDGLDRDDQWKRVEDLRRKTLLLPTTAMALASFIISRAELLQGLLAMQAGHCSREEVACRHERHVAR